VAPSAVPWDAPGPGLAATSLRLLGARAGAFPHAETLIAEILIREGDPAGAVTFLREARTNETPLPALVTEAIALEASGQPALAAWKTLADRKADGIVERELVALACLRMAEAELAAGRNPDFYLERIGTESRGYGRAVHIRALTLAERGDRLGAEKLFHELWETRPPYDGRAQVGLFLGGVALEDGAPEDAHALYGVLDAEWETERAAIRDGQTPDGRERLWREWESAAYWPRGLGLDLSGAWAASRDLAQRALDLRGSPSPPPLPDLAREAACVVPPETGASLVPPPLPEERDALARRWAAVARAGNALAEAERALREREADIRRRLAYHERGLEWAGDERSELAPVASELDSLLADLDVVLEQLRGLKDSAVRRFTQRTRDLVERARMQQLWIRALQHLHVDGPRTSPLFAVEASPEVLLREEDALARTLESWTARLHEMLPGLLDTAYADVWAPGLVDQAHALRAAAAGQERRLGVMSDSMRVALDALADDPVTAALRDRVRRGAAERDSLRRVFAAARDSVADACIARALAAHGEAREAIDYGLMASAYESHAARTAAPDSLGRARRIEATRRHTAFLQDYPQSMARAETRFRLADLLLVDAKDAFNEGMSRFLSDSLAATGKTEQAFVPFVDYGPALDLYRAILAGDSTYIHRDAVLFNLGMILSDQGDPEAAGYLQELVAVHPESPFIQEAQLRRGDQQFDAYAFAPSIPLYEEAARGDDPGLAAIALYRIGWARFSLDEFEKAADAFRRLLDLYADREEADEEIALKTDLRPEGEDYLIHSLARGGGAPLFARYFDGIGRRAYESRILSGMAGLFQEFSQYAEAIEADALFLERFPTDPKALDSARRLIACYDDWNRPQDARKARLRYARAFQPGSPWHSASSWNRTQGEAFARDCYQRVALYHHQRARKNGSDADWQAALELYETLIRLWPGHEESATCRLSAGEAATKLEDYETAVTHYRAAADELRPRLEDPKAARDADWQVLAVTDAWYLSTVPSAADAAALGVARRGTDELARAVREAAGTFIHNHYHDEKVPEALWRKGTLAFAHAWYVDAASDFADLAVRFPEDANTPRAAALRGDALYRTSQFDEAGKAYAAALAVAEAAGVDSLSARLRPLIPVCAYRYAETTTAYDTDHPEHGAALYEDAASRWPDYEHAGRAWYQAGLGYRQAGRTEDAVRAFNRLIETDPGHEFAKDAHLQIAAAWEASGHTALAALAYRRISRTYPEDTDAAGALLKAAELLTAAGEAGGADSVRTEYLDRFPEDVETGMSILEDLGTRELAALPDGAAISPLLAVKKNASPGYLARYLKLAEANPDFASPRILARVQFLRGEELYGPYAALPLTLPIDKSIAAKKGKLEALLAVYGVCGNHGVAEWTRAAAYRIGEALIAFGRALETSERPAGLEAEDLAAYDEVLLNEAWTFFDRGEAAWSDLLRETREAEDDPGDWIAATQRALWPRLGEKFLFMPEVEYPVVAAGAPAPVTGKNDSLAKGPEEGVSNPPAARGNE
jgi:tetratricopeptide (TPR) repeat protein